MVTAPLNTKDLGEQNFSSPLSPYEVAVHTRETINKCWLDGKYLSLGFNFLNISN